MNRRHKNYKNTFLNLIDKIKCDVTDSEGRHCPGKVKYRVETNRGEAYLCDSCLNNVKNGAYKGIKINDVENYEYTSRLV